MPDPWTVFLVAFPVVAAWETVRPDRESTTPAGSRWLAHGVLWLAGATAENFAFRVTATALAFAAFDRRFGAAAWNPAWAVIFGAASFLALDWIRYLLHRMMHAVPWLWRLHSVHHSDPDYDLSTGLRFHPLEVLVTGGGYLAFIVVAAPHPVAVLCYEVVTAASNLFSHANVAIPDAADRILRRLVVTPDLHRIHHSRDAAAQQSNFGVLLPWWDRLFGTLRDSGSGVLGMDGVDGMRGISMRFLLSQPFQRTEPGTRGPERG